MTGVLHRGCRMLFFWTVETENIFLCFYGDRVVSCCGRSSVTGGFLPGGFCFSRFFLHNLFKCGCWTGISRVVGL